MGPKAKDPKKSPTRSKSPKKADNVDNTFYGAPLSEVCIQDLIFTKCQI